MANANNGAIYSATLNNCTVTSNTVPGTSSCTATNSIIYYNGGISTPNYSGGTFSYCCVTPAATGSGNFTNAPRLLPDGIHLSTNSPCIGAGTIPVTSADIFGNPWANPPSIGCAEVPNIPVLTQPQVRLTGSPAGFTVGNDAISGVGPFTFQWLQNGVLLQDNGNFSGSQTANLLVTNLNFGDAGAYQLIVSNDFGATTSAVAQVVIHCVDVNSANPVAPYTNWMTAATNIQSAITAAASEDIILVTNGVYATGGISMDGIITNRVSLNKVLLVQSVNGPGATVIQGAWDPTSTNGPAAVRCVWMTNNSILSGFTIYGGATRAVTSSPNLSMMGGGVCASSNSAVVWNCIIATNYASDLGGGAFSATLIDCTLIGNHAFGSGTPGFGVANAGSGGGASGCNLVNCLLTSNAANQSNGGGAQNCNATNCALVNNTAAQNGSGIYEGKLVNCTIANNTAGSVGGLGYSGSGAAANAILTNCIVYGNFNVTAGGTNYNSCTFGYCDTDPLPAGTGNIDVNPQLLPDDIHLAYTSPCIGAGTSNIVSGTDIDGQPWNNPPSMGCDEWQPTPLVAVQPVFQVGLPSRRFLNFDVVAAGQPPFSYYWYQNGSLLEDDGHDINSGSSNLMVNGFEPEDAGTYQVVVSNSFGVVTSQVTQVVIHTVASGGNDPVPPYSGWDTAATNIQDAIDAANAGDIVLVTNGLYNTGGRVVSGALTNRVALDKALTVISVNGYAATMIAGQPDPVSTNGPGAVRCAWLTSGAVLTGFTLANGATSGSEATDGNSQFGGGAWLAQLATINNCVFTNNCAYSYGGGAAFIANVGSGGGVVYPGQIHNSFFTGNTAQYGGGTYGTVVANCTFLNNYCLANFGAGGGTYGGIVQNSIVVDNFELIPFIEANYYDAPNPFYTYSCTDPLPTGAGNIDANLNFLDSTFHLPAVSPIRGAGSSLYTIGTDLDDQPWANPPSMGCSELILSNLVGPLAVAIRPPAFDAITNSIYGLLGTVTGRATSLNWSFGDGTVATNAGYSLFHTWTNSGDYTVTLTAYNLDNPSGVSTNVLVAVDPLYPPVLGSAGVVSNSFQFTFSAQTNADYTVQYTTNLAPPVTWETLRTIYFSPGGVTTIQDLSATNPVRFYRVQPQ